MDGRAPLEEANEDACCGGDAADSVRTGFTASCTINAAAAFVASAPGMLAPLVSKERKNGSPA
jgi:hypothetical protein